MIVLFILLSFASLTIQDNRILFITTDSSSSTYLSPTKTTVVYSPFDSEAKTTFTWNNFIKWKSTGTVLVYSRINDNYFYFLNNYDTDPNTGITKNSTLNRVNLQTRIEDELFSIPCSSKTIESQACNQFINFKIKTFNNEPYLQVFSGVGTSRKIRISQIPLKNTLGRNLDNFQWDLTFDYLYETITPLIDFVMETNYTKRNTITNNIDIANASFVATLSGSYFTQASNGIVSGIIPKMLFPAVNQTLLPGGTNEYRQYPERSGASFYILPYQSTWTLYIYNPLSTNQSSVYGRMNMFSTNITIPDITYPEWKIITLEIDPEYYNYFYVIATKTPYQCKVLQLVFDYSGIWVDGSPTLMIPENSNPPLLYSRVIADLQNWNNGAIISINVAKYDPVINVKFNNGIKTPYCCLLIIVITVFFIQ
jgi:hypothetical protein